METPSFEYGQDGGPFGELARTGGGVGHASGAHDAFQ
jgi:hypothetical protein